MFFHTFEEGLYWDESAHYEFTRSDIDVLEAATYELDRLCLKAVQHVLDEKRLGEFLIPPEFERLVRESWDNDDPTIYGRFDFSYDGKSPPKLLEYNADTPTGLIEAAVTQWFWLQDKFPERNQFNSLHERLIEAWKSLKAKTPGGLHFAALAGNIEDYMTVNYLRDTAIQAGWQTAYIDIEKIGWNERRRTFTDLAERPMQTCFKLYTGEWMFDDAFGPKLNYRSTRWLESPWKALLSNKAILPVLWELFPNHPNLLQCRFEPLHDVDYVQKPILSREGANVQIFESGRLLAKTEGPYDGPCVYQEFWELPEFDGNRPVIGSWMVDGWACGIGIREDKTLITGNNSRFIPHLFG
jgi:glutathionylspermidine synthase